MIEWRHAPLDNFPALRPLRKFLIVDGSYIAGGCFKHMFEGKSPRDLDMYFTTEEAFDKAKRSFLDDGWTKKYESGNAFGIIKDNVSIDLVKFAYKPAEQMIGDFDFTVTKFALVRAGTDENGEEVFKVVYHPDFFEHLATKRLVIDDRLKLPINTFQRMFKYIRYGFDMCRESKIKLLVAVREWTPENGDDVRSGLEGDLARGLYEAMD